MKRISNNFHSRQSGAVLIIAMIILLMLTLLGVTAMNTSSLEEKMAGNAQEQVHAFQAAESGYSQAFTDPLAYSGNTCPGGATFGPVTVTDYSGSDNDLTYCAKFMGFSEVPPSNPGLWGTTYHAMHFVIRSTGTSGSNLSATLNGGAYRIAYKPGS